MRFRVVLALGWLVDRDDQADKISFDKNKNEKRPLTTEN